MKRRKSIIGAFALCALAVFAFGAANASATGLTAVKCVKLGAEHKYKSSHCTTPGEGGEYETVQLEKEVPTNVEGTSTTNKHEPGSTTNPSVIFKASLSGLNTTITCADAHLKSGKVTNTEAEGEMKIHGTELVFTYTECHASLDSSPTKTCRVQGTSPADEVGMGTTNKLTMTSGANHVVTIKPETEAFFMKFKILKKAEGEECPFGSDVPVEVKGEVNGIANTETHSHITLNPENNGTKLLANGAKATYESTQQTWMAGEPEVTVGAETF